MFGGPSETKETVKEGIENIRSLRNTANFMFMGIRILPNTGLMEIAQSEGILESGQDIIEPVYYFSPNIDRDWLQQTLIKGFVDKINCVFPPDALDDKLRILHKLGFCGSAYEMLIKSGKRQNSMIFSAINKKDRYLNKESTPQRGWFSTTK
jgi:hypothetical protein